MNLDYRITSMLSAIKRKKNKIYVYNKENIFKIKLSNEIRARKNILKKVQKKIIRGKNSLCEFWNKKE